MNEHNMIYEFTIGLFNKLCELVDILFDFLFTEITIGDWKISMWALLSGTLITVFIVAWFVKKLVPVA